ncbi:hypothetical protein BLTE_27330 [Blastochloris tepida]|uniref:O-antigen ligase-related domain-containing protein n=2 Tax=Blastochloris tepida TaxID=2233851 RepID=A0A348G3B5_9HYPH|nr:hypothetical protein BLTE_27330 [Blastochloris tepida]
MQMIQPATSLEGRSAIVLALILGVLAPGLLVIASQSTQITAPLGFALAAGILAATGRGPALGEALRAEAFAPLGLALGLFLAWILTSTAWAPRPGYSLGVAGQIALVAATGVLGLAAVPAALPRGGWRWLVAGVALAAVLALIELRFGTPIRALIGAKSKEFRLNHAAITLAVLAWPAAAALALCGQRWLAAALVALVAAAALSSEAQASVLGVLAGGAALGLAWLFGRWAVWASAGAMVALVAATPLLMARAGDLVPAAMHGILKRSAWERIQIWHRFAEAVPDRWFAGHGIQASRDFADIRPIQLLPAERFNPLSAGHTHNAVLQVWVELGAVGAALLAILLVLIAGRIARLPTASRGFALATFASLFAIAYVSHGAWQIWWLAAIALGAVWMRAVAEMELPAGRSD